MYQTPTPQVVAQMMMLRMTPTFPHPKLILTGKEKGWQVLVGNGVAREGIEEEAESDADGDEEEEIFDVQDINPSSYMHMGTPIFQQPHNPDWMEKISYKGKTNLVREKGKENPRLVEKEDGIDYRFHTTF
jgi:hypothetical protein